ncbi:MAG TPA: response regulator transcription factor [Solirubrobacterales bacterium]|nr:response regulator transcription factor [Solirubrobacterales bacterium]
MLAVAIVDGDPLARRAIRTRLAAEDDLVVVGEASDSATGIELVWNRRPDMVLIALSLPDRSGSEAMREMLTISPQTRVIVLAVDPDEDAQMHALRMGAAGCLPKATDLEVLPRVLRGVRAGEAAVTRALATRVLEQVRMLDRGGLDRFRPVRSSLTQREWEVLDLLVEGTPMREIARQLDISLTTVRSHVKHVHGKLGVHSRDEAVRYVKRLRRALRQ